ncbi:hypothetical protein AURDEDRAFT_159381 [Auricularia subglabra TFB-10046 SS5]|nr:hypothetical protein AURDEDRAFT_159381 [Auricularia subglabra TFB-10046 SS5]
MGGDASYFDPDSATYDQHRFILRSGEEAQAEQSSKVGPVEKPNFKTTKHFIWTMEEFNTPIPLGKYGQPYFPKSSWEDFDPERLWRDVGAGRVAKGDELWAQLARDAARLPFEFRSNAQRVVVSEAHRAKSRGEENAILPLPGEVGEIDVWHMCTNNALYMPLAVRRQYTFDPSNGTLYREWDVGDLGIYVIMRACGPEAERRKAKEKRKRDETESGRSIAVNWTELFRRAVLWGAEQSDTIATAAFEFTKARRYNGGDDVGKIWEHLLRCGFAIERMRLGGDVHAYALRMERQDGAFQQMKNELEREKESMDIAGEGKDVVAAAKSRLELADERIPQGRPLVRFKVKEKDALGREVMKVLERQAREDM